METRSSSSSFNQLVLLVLVTLLTLPNCSASKGTKKDGVGVPGRDDIKAKVDLAEIRIVSLVGRKMMSEGSTGMRNGGVKTEEGKKQSAAGEEAAASKNISGNKKSSATASAYQNDAALKKSENGSFEKLDKVVEGVQAGNEIVSLVNTDYEGNGGPGDRPPINNHEPLH